MNLNSPPAFQFYVDDFIGGTFTMTNEERGLYISLLCVQWNQGFVDDEDIERMSGRMSESSIARVRRKFEEDDHGQLRNERMEKERYKQAQYRLSRSQNGKQGGRPSKPQDKHAKTTCFSDVKPVVSQPETTPQANQKPPSPSPSPSSDTDLLTTLPPTPNRAFALGGVFKRRESTPWSEKELKAFKESALKAHPEDFDLVIAYYQSDAPYKRKDLQTLLNNWNGEVDRARDWKANPTRQNGHAPGRGPVTDRPPSGFDEGMEEFDPAKHGINATNPQP